MLKAINLAENALPMVLDLGAVEFVPEQKTQMTVLQGDSLAVNNDLDEPNRVTPVNSEIVVAGRQIPVEFPAYSLSVIRIKADKE